MPICRLCHNDRTLRNSHIVPEFLYDGLYNDNHQMMGINGLGNRGWKSVQKGIREYLLCDDCERHINDEFEKPFRAQWVEAPPLPNPFRLDAVRWCQFDYTTFKLFHLSVLFRAGVSSLPTFAAVSLGSHEEKLRKLLLSVTPGESWRYPVFGYAIVHHETHRLIPIVTRAERSSLNGHRCYGMAYGGVHWWVSVSSHRNLELETAGLRANGQMPFHSIPWNEIATIQSAAEALRRARL